MKKTISLTLLIFPLLCGYIYGQSVKQEIKLEDIVKNRTFQPKAVPILRPMLDGEHYSILKDNKIEMHNYADGKINKTIFDASEFNELKNKKIQGYMFSSEEKYLMFYINKEMRYRNSFSADYYIYRIDKKKLDPLSTNGAQEQATFSPDERKIAFVRDNNIFIKKLDFGTESAVTNDGKKNEIINGEPDWVYEEEFELTKAFEWSSDSRYIGFLKFNESKVKSYSFPMYEGANPSIKNNSQYPNNYTYKYPKSGETNSSVSAHIYDLITTKLQEISDLNITSDDYMPRISWVPNSDKLALFKLNRHQNQLEMYYTDPKTLISKLALKLSSDTYLSPDSYRKLTFINNSKNFVCFSENDGYNHLYLYNFDGSLVNQITKGKFEVTSFIGYNPISKIYYFQASKKSPMEREVYSIDSKGELKCLTENAGTNNIEFSKNYKYYCKTFSNISTPTITSVFNAKGEQLYVLEDNKELNKTLEKYQISKKEFFSFNSDEGIKLNGWMVKPTNFDKSKKYPVLMVQYSGPNSQQVLNRWELNWEQYLASQGYIIACIDGRGTGARGEEFRKCTYLQLGKLESEDQINSAKYLANLSFVDPKRIGIWGWSFGGFMTELCMTKGNGIFKAGIAVAPVSHWKYYDSVYTERYMRTPKENEKGYNDNSPLELADKLKGAILICHGTADDNVHYQNTAEFSERLVQANIPFDMQIYTNRNHSIYDATGATRLHLYAKFCSFLKDNL